MNKDPQKLMKIFNNLNHNNYDSKIYIVKGKYCIELLERSGVGFFHCPFNFKNNYQTWYINVLNRYYSYSKIKKITTYKDKKLALYQIMINKLKESKNEDEIKKILSSYKSSIYSKFYFEKLKVDYPEYII